jgi:5-methylcytosine-specific restriction endonuclease McrA
MRRYEFLTGDVILGYNDGMMDREFHSGDDQINVKRKPSYKADRQRLWTGQKGICHWCGKECVFNGTGGENNLFTVDHIIPLSANGTNHWRNLIGSCSACNNGRNKKWEFVRLIEWRTEYEIGF